MAVPLHDPGVARKRQVAWIVILGLSPLAYFGAAAIEERLPHQASTAAVSREQALASGRAFAASLHTDVSGWKYGITTSDDSRIGRLLDRTHPPAIDSVAAPTVIETHFGRSARDWVIVTERPDGEVLGFRSSKPDKAGQPIDEAKARGIAEQYLRERLGAGSPLRLNDSRVTAGSDNGGWIRHFTWEFPIDGLPQATAKVAIEIAGDRIVSERRSADFQPDFRKTLSEPKGRWADARKIGTVVLFALFAIYAVVRYVQRSLEKEISHRRTLMVIGAFVVVGCAMMFGNDQFGVAAASGSQTAAAVWFAFITGFVVVGVFFGVAYGAGEGDLREMYPGKLCSLDALLSGKIFSANFARSLLGGAAVAGWLLLAQNAALLAASGGPVGGEGWLSPNPSIIYPLIDLTSDSTISLVLAFGYGLLLPLTLLRKWKLRPWTLYTLLVLFCAIAADVAAPNGNTWRNSVILVSTLVAAICGPFFFGDLVASVTSLFAVALVGDLLRRSAVTAQWHAIAYGEALPAAVAFLAVELFFAWRGRLYDEEEVRPLYARNLAHRQALSAEIAAARVAQLRLLPDAPPPIAGLTIAGSCTTAREVGGDFFDYYALDTHRVALFVAEGGDRELGSAMAIALAKGLLLYTSSLDLPPIEVLRRLRTTLGSVLHGEATLTVLYAVIDGRDGSLRYARSGRSPRLLLNGAPLAEEIVADRADGFEIRHGAATLAENGTLLVFTDGLSRQLARRSPQRVEETVRELGRRCGEASDVHRAVLDAAFRRKKDTPPDDVTTVVICRPAVATEQAVGGIA